MAPSQSEGSVRISSAALDVRPQFGKTVDHIIFQSKSRSFKKNTSVRVLPGHRHEEVFVPALNLSVQDRLTVSVQYKSSWRGRRTLSIPVELSDAMTNAQGIGHGNQTHITSRKNIEVTIVVSRYSAPSESSPHVLLPSTIEDLPPPITNEIREICPRFRLLVIGNSGVGKSTLIREVFGVQEVDVSERSRGKADINSEFVAKENGFFVLHDSIGLEAADRRNFDTIKSFISDRRQRENLKDRLHAVWVCLEVPLIDGQLLEAGMEDFLRDREQILGDIPIVVVLTKLDLLDISLSMKLRKEGIEFKTMEEARPLLEPRRSKFLDDFCTQPLREATGGDIPHVAVSTRSGFGLEPTIPELVEKTTSEIERSINANVYHSAGTEWPSIEQHALFCVAGMAQRRSVEPKLVCTIKLWERYRTNLVARLTISTNTVKRCLLDLHWDIIQIWNLNDPEKALQSEDFKGALLDPSNVLVEDTRDAGCMGTFVAPIASTLRWATKTLTRHELTLPLTGVVTLENFVREAYKSPQIAVKRFMAYIVDLTYVMKILLIRAPQGPISSQDVPFALQVYKRLSYRNRVHLDIHDFNPSLGASDSDAVVEKIGVLIRRYNITNQDLSRFTKD